MAKSKNRTLKGLRRALTDWRSVLVVLWVIWAVANVFLNGTVWWWNIFMMIPPLFLFAASLVAILLAWRLKLRLYVAAAVIAAVITVPFYKFDIAFFPAEARAESVKVVVWNTRAWHDDQGRSEFIQLLKGKAAEVYVLQEAFDNNLQFVDAKADLQAEFPDYEIVQHADLVTLSKYTVKKSAHSEAHGLWGGFLRTDLEIEGKIVSVYNIHLPIPLHPLRLIRPEGLNEVKTLYDARKAHWKALYADLNNNQEQKLIAGDFNTTELDYSMQSLRNDRRFDQVSNSGFFPASYELAPLLKLWRIDWIFTTNGIKGRQLEQVAIPGGSDHDLFVVEWSF